MYTFPTEARSALEAMPVPLAYYQWDGAGQIVATLVSDGLCRMMNADRQTLTSLLNGSMFDRIHPDDAGRVARITASAASSRRRTAGTWR